MYRRAAFPVANLLSDLPFSAVRIFTYNLVVYFMIGLNRSAGGFWTFHLISYTTFLAMQGFFRTFGLCFQNFDTAFRMSVIFFPNIVQYSGYLIPENLMKRWLFWIYYINPFSYSWAGLMENESSRISLVCEGAYVVPRNGPGMDKYPNIVGPNQACTLYGAQPGSSVVSGADYIKAGFSLDVDDLWRRNFLVVVGWLFFFIITQMLVIEYLQVSYPLWSCSSRRMANQRAFPGTTARGHRLLHLRQRDFRDRRAQRRPPRETESPQAYRGEAGEIRGQGKTHLR